MKAEEWKDLNETGAHRKKLFCIDYSSYLGIFNKNVGIFIR